MTGREEHRSTGRAGAGFLAVLARREPQLLAAFRVMVALLLLQHALQKLVGVPVPYPYGPLTPLLAIAAVIEGLGGLLVLIGLATRPAAFILAGEMAVAYFMAHAPRGLFPLVNGGELAVLFCFSFLYLAAAGPGAWSLDGMRSGHRDR